MNGTQRSETLLRVIAALGLLVIAVLGLSLWSRSTHSDGPPSQTADSEVPAADQAEALQTGTSLTPPDVESQLLPTVPAQPTASEVGARGLVLYGLVTDAAGQPIERATLRAREIRTVTRVTGYSIAGLQPGPALITCSATGYDPLEREMDLPPSPATQRLDLVLHKATIVKVRILTPEGEPLYEVLERETREGRLTRHIQVTALATRDAPRGHFPPTMLRNLSDFGVGTWRDGQDVLNRNRLPRELAGELQLSVDPPVYVSAVLRHHVLATEQVTAGQEEVTLTVPLAAVEESLGSLRVAFMDAATGMAVEGVRVSVTDAQSAGGGSRTDQTGSVRISGLRPGLLELVAAPAGYARIQTNLIIESGRELDLGVIRMHEPRRLHGVVLDRQGEPVAALVRARALDPVVPGQPVGRPSRRDSTAAEGFEMSIAPGRYLIRAESAAAGKAYAVVDLTQAPVEDLRLQLAPTVTVEVRCNFSEVELYDVQILDAQRNPIWEDRMPKREGYRIELVPDSYMVSIRDGQKLIREYPLTVTGNGGTVIVP